LLNVCVACPRTRAPVIAGRAKDAKIAIIEITTKSSTSVNAAMRFIKIIELLVLAATLKKQEFFMMMKFLPPSRTCSGVMDF
jgi:hypothetical protein